MKGFLKQLSISFLLLLALPFTVNGIQTSFGQAKPGLQSSLPSGKVGTLSNSIPIFVPAPAQYNEVACGTAGMGTIAHFTHWEDPSRRIYRFLFQASGGSIDGAVNIGVQSESWESIPIPAGSLLTNYSVELTSIYTDERPIDLLVQAGAGTCNGGIEYPMVVRNLNIQAKP